MRSLISIIFTLILVVFLSSAVGAETMTGISFEFGSNYIQPLDSGREPGMSNLFVLNFSLSESLSFGYYRENAIIDGIDVNINAIQTRNRIGNIVEGGVRFGSAELAGAGNFSVASLP